MIAPARSIFIFIFLLAVNGVRADTIAIDGLINRSIELRNLNRIDSSMSVAEKALNISLAENYSAGITSAYYQLGKAAIANGGYTSAMKYFLSADSINELNHDDRGLSQTKLQLGLLEYIQKNYTDALPYFDLSLQTSAKTGEKKNTGVAKYLKGLIYLQLDSLPLAEALLKDAMKIRQDLTDEQGYYECIGAMASLELKRKNLDQSESLYRMCLHYFLKSENMPGVAISENGLGNIFYERNETDSAITYLERSFRLSRESKYFDIVMKSSKTLSEIFRKRNEPAKALEYQNVYYNLHDSLFNIDNTRQIAKLQYQLALTKNQVKIDDLNRRRAKDKIILILMLSTTILLIVITIILYRNFRFKQKANNHLEATLRELKNTQQQLIQSEKLASLGHLTAGLAHELKNPLNFIINFSATSIEMAEDFSGSDTNEKPELIKEIKMNLSKIQSHGMRANSIINNMMMHARKPEESKIKTNLGLLLKDTIDLAYQGMKATHHSFTCTLDINIPDRKVFVHVIPQEIGRIILNILNNAFYSTVQRQSIESGYIPLIKITLTITGKLAEIVIEDNAIGMSEETISRIFEPFFTTKPTGEGTGLGLSMSYDMMQSNGGEISVESEPMIYTRFTLKLPVTEAG